LYKYIDLHQDGKSTIPSWILTTDGSETIEVDTSALTEPQSAYFTVRYYNEIGTSAFFYDFPVHVRVKAKESPVYADQSYSSLATCTQNIFPMSYGTDNGKHINLGIYIVEADTSNKHILLCGKSYALSPDDGSGNYDGYV
jgi:hypothetical protein